MAMQKTQGLTSSGSTINPLVFKLKLLLRAILHRDLPRRVQLIECISFNDLKRATDSFRRIIAWDPRGTTYEAKFQDGSLSVAKEVKVDQQNDMFYKKVLLLGRLHHRHVVGLRGYSVGHRSFLVYEGTVQGSLKEHLNDPLRTPLSWKTRVKIAIGVAAALEYLQRFCDPTVHHFSISSSDIILDEKLTPKLSNIGCGSLEGYQVKTSEQTIERADLIPQFGTLILELITGQSLVKESNDLLKLMEDSPYNISMDNVIDPDLGLSYNFKQLKALLALAKFCLKATNESRFSISHVFWYLQKIFHDC